MEKYKIIMYKRPRPTLVDDSYILIYNLQQSGTITAIIPIRIVHGYKALFLVYDMFV